VFEGTPNEKYADEGEHGRDRRGDKHPESPKSHALLGIQIAFFVVVVAFACCAALFGYLLADRGFDALDRGDKWGGVALFWCGVSLACGGSAFIIWAGLRLSFWWWFPGLL
jgi:hypothetical protein